MKLLARLLISLELFWSDPAKWWARQAGFLKLALLVFVVPGISAASILMYQKALGATPQQFANLESKQREELSLLKQELNTIRSQQETLLNKFGGGETLGASTSTAAQIRAKVQDSLRQQSIETQANLETLAGDTATVSASVYILPGETPTTKLYKNPDKASAVVATIHTDTVQKLIKRQGDWYQLQLDNGKYGWIPVALVLAMN